MNERSRVGAGLPSPNILVIDDDEIVLAAITDMLECAGYHVHALASPIGATQVIASQGIALAVIDLNMPVMRGDRFISLVRSWDRIRDLPIILVSGESTETIRAAAEHLPGVSVVTKGQMSERLVPTISSLLHGTELAPSSGSARSATRLEKVPPNLTRSLAVAAKAVLANLRDVSAGRAPVARLASLIEQCRQEAQAVALENTAAVLRVAAEAASAVRPPNVLSTELTSTLQEVLTMLANDGLEKLTTYDKSLAVTVHRARVERVRLG